MSLTLDQAQHIVKVYTEVNNSNPYLFKPISDLPFPKEDIKLSVKYLILFFKTLHSQNNISDQEYQKLLNDHITIYISLATYLDDPNRLERLNKNEAINNAFECIDDMTNAVQLIQRMDLTDLIYNDVLNVVNESMKLEGEIRRFLKKKDLRM